MVSEIWRRSKTEPPGARRCPFCAAPMATVEVTVSPTDPAVRLDLCRVDQLVWFDPGEVEALPASSGADPGSQPPIIVNHWASATEDLGLGSRSNWILGALVHSGHRIR